MNVQKILTLGGLSMLIAVSTLIQRCEASIVNVPKEDKMELVILHNNDMHARFEQTSQISSACSKVDAEQNKCYGGFARVANRVKDARRKAADGTGPPVLYLNAGDTYTGTVWFTLYKWKIAADFINMLRPDAVSLGNHEFDEGIQGLSPFIRNLSCPVLCANIELTGEPELKQQNLKKSVVLDVKGRKVGIVGYLTPETKYLVAPNHVEYIDEVVALQKEVNNLMNQGVQIIIGLGHSGYESDLRIAKEVKGIDLVIGGHSNTFMWNGESPDIELPVGPYPVIVEQESGKKVPVIQAFAYTKYLGRLHLTFDSMGEIIEYDGQPILLDGSVERDSDVLQLLETYRPRVVSYVETTVGSTQVVIDGSTETCRMHECNMGNLITDAMIYSYASSSTPPSNGWSVAPIALIQGGGIRASISEGNISRADILAALPFENEIVVADVKGDILHELLEWSVHDYSEVSGAFLQVSGLRVEYDLSKPAGNRVIKANVRCGECLVPRYSPLEKNQMYKIIMPDFLLNGGDKYTMLVENAEIYEKLGKTDGDILENYIRKKSPLYPEVQGRVLIHGQVSSAVALKTNIVLVLITMLHFCITRVLA